MPRALVIGGGPAGATAAATLAAGGGGGGGGWDVTLCEAARFPRDKVCGECLSALGVATLREAGLGDALDALRPHRLTHAALVDRRGRAARLALPREVLGVTRAALDAALLDALPPGVERRQPCRVLRLQSHTPDAAAAAAGSVERRSRSARSTRGFRRGVGGVRAHTTQGDIDADLVLVADGKGTLPGTVADPPAPTGDLGLKAHFAGVDLDPAAVALFALAGHYVGLAQVATGDGGHVWNLAFNVPATKLRPGEPHDDLLQRLLGENAAFREAMRGATRVGDWKASPLPRFAPRPSATWPANVIPIGNAAAALEPIGGEGMGLAIASARAAAMAVIEDRPIASLDRVYRDLWRTRRAACRTAALAMSHQSTAAAIVALARLVPAIGRVGMRLAGKTSSSPPGVAMRANAVS